MRIRCLKCCFFVLLCSNLVFADDITVTGETEHTIPITAPTVTDTKSITALEYELSDEAQRVLSQRADRLLQRTDVAQIRSLAQAKSSSVQLGMNHVGVLDQGRHGTCATFAITAAMDAVLKKGSYISQLCLLQLGRYFENNGQGKSGWSGIADVTVLARIKNYGVFNIKNQRRYGCGGVKEYPYSVTPQIEMSPEAYQQHNEDIVGTRVSWEYLYVKPNVLLNEAEASRMVDRIKAALSAGHRVIFSTLLPRSDLGTMGAVGWHHYFNDTWVLTDEISQDLRYSKKISGHEMIITGYDDQATARDHSGRLHHGLFKIRNSWGYWVADWGDFYMSYDYFKIGVNNAIAIIRV